MTETTLPTYKLGSIPDVTMWEGTLAFRLDKENFDLQIAGAKLQKAVEAAQGAVQTAQTPLSDLLLKPVPVKQLEDRLEESAQAIAAAKQFAQDVGLAQVPTLNEAANWTAQALEAVRGLPALIELWHRHPPPKASSQIQASFKAACHRALECAELSAACLRSAAKALAEEPFAVEPRPYGRILLNPGTGVFEYYRDTRDSTPFKVRFFAGINGKPVSQTVTITPVPRLPATTKEITDQRIGRSLFETQLESRYNPDPKKLILTGLDLTVDQELLRGSLTDINVCGHIVRVSGKLKADEGATNLSIFARYVAFAPGASIDVSGTKGEDRSDVANGGRSAGDPGADGDRGNPGQDGGTIRIVAEQIIGAPTLLANGGPGGRGQNGGPGAKGKQGAHGQDDVLHETYSRLGVTHSVITDGTAGKPGEQGGKGGRAGQRGDHGNGGSICIETVLPCPAGSLQANPGQDFLTAADTEAKPGEGGKGGDGGGGGSKFLYDRPYVGPKFGKYDNGPEGPKGDPGDPAPEAVKGAAGKISKKPIGYADFCSALACRDTYAAYGTPDSALLSIVLSAAERLYLNAESPEDIEALQEVLDYVLRVTAYPAVEAMQPKIRTIHERCSVLRANLACGLDFFGKTSDFVPSLSLEENEQFYNSFRDAAKDLEADYDLFWDKKTTEEAKKAAVKSQIRRAENLVEQDLKPRLEKLESSVLDLNKSINSLTDQAITAETELRKKAGEFEEELREKQTLDILWGTVNMAWSIVMAGVNSKDLFTSGVAWLKDITKQEGPRTPDGQLVKSFGRVKGGLESIYADYKQCCQQREWKDDSVKLVLDDLNKDQFDREIDGFLDVPGAKALKEAARKYFDLVSQRNKAIVEHDSAVQQVHNIRAQINVARHEAADLWKQIEIDDNPQRPIFVQYMSSTMQLVKSFIIETLYMMFRSTDYYTLTRAALRLTDYRVSALEKQYTETLKRLQNAAEEVGARSEIVCSHVIDDPAQLEQLRQHKPVWLYLPLNTNNPPIPPFANIERPMVRKIQCYFEGLTSPDPQSYATVSIEHSGISYLYNEISRTIWSFAHAPRTISFQYQIGDIEHELSPGDLTEGGKFMMLSPFALWGVRFRREDGENQKLELSTLKKVELRFLVKGKVSPIARVSPQTAQQ